MQKLLPTLFFYIFVQFSYSQEINSARNRKYDFTLNSGYQRMDMKDLNLFYADSFFSSVKPYTPIHHAFYKSMQFNYRLNPLFSIGTQLKMDQASSMDRFTVLNRSISITGQMDGMELLRQFTQKPMKGNWDLQLQAGLSFHLMQIKKADPTLFWECFPEPWIRTTRLGGIVQAKLSYPIFTGRNTQWRLGVNLAYQYAQSKVISDDQFYASTSIQKNVTLGFSGFSSGLSLSCAINQPRQKTISGLSKNAIYIDILGQSVYGALVYERCLNSSSNGVHHSVSGGYFSLVYLPWTYANSRFFSIPLSYNATFDFNRTENLPNKLELGLGLTTFFNKSFGFFVQERYQEFAPSVRIGYVYKNVQNGLLLKATMTPIVLGIIHRSNNGLPASPNYTWAKLMFGVSIGKTF